MNRALMKTIPKVLALMILSLIILGFETDNFTRLEIERNSQNNETIDYDKVSYSELIEEQFQRYEQNKSYYESFPLSDGTIVTFADDQYLSYKYPYYQENNISLFGLYSINNQEIFVNVDRINNFYEDEQDTLEAISGTFIHELVHYIETQLYSNAIVRRTPDEVVYLGTEVDFYDDYGDSVDEPYNSMIDFETNVLNSSTYEPDDYYSEILARKIAVCWREYDGEYTGIYDAFVFQDNIEYCTQSIFVDDIESDTTIINNMLTNLLQSYERTYRLNYYEVEKVNKNETIQD